MRIAVCDDNPETIDELVFFLKNIERTANAEICTYRTSGALLEEIEKGKGFDLYILDMYINEILGIDVAKEIRQHDKHAYIIFATSSASYAVQSYSVQALHYLLKPINVKELEEAVMRMDFTEEESISCTGEYGDKFLIKISDIISIENNRNRQDITTLTEKAYVYSTMRKLSELLMDKENFYRLNSGTIINLDYVQKINSKELTMKNKSIFSVPRGKYRIIKALLPM